MDTKQYLKEALERFPSTIEEGAEYVENVLRSYADHLEATEPYATRAIDSLRAASDTMADAVETVEED